MVLVNQSDGMIRFWFRLPSFTNIRSLNELHIQSSLLKVSVTDSYRNDLINLNIRAPSDSSAASSVDFTPNKWIVFSRWVFYGGKRQMRGIKILIFATANVWLHKYHSWNVVVSHLGFAFGVAVVFLNHFVGLGKKGLTTCFVFSWIFRIQFGMEFGLETPNSQQDRYEWKRTYNFH